MVFHSECKYLLQRLLAKVLNYIQDNLKIKFAEPWKMVYF